MRYKDMNQVIMTQASRMFRIKPRSDTRFGKGSGVTTDNMNRHHIQDALLIVFVFKDLTKN